MIEDVTGAAFTHGLRRLVVASYLRQVKRLLLDAAGSEDCV